MAIKIGVAIAPIANKLFEDIQKLVETIFVNEIGIKHIEIHTQFLDDFTEFWFNLSKKSGMSYSIHCPHMYFKIPTNFCSANAKDILISDEWLEKSIKYSKKLKVKNIIIHPDLPKDCKKSNAKQHGREILLEHIKRAISMLNKKQSILIETMPDKDYCLSTPNEFKKFLKNFNSKEKKHIGICWDIGHGIQAVGEKKKLNFPRLLKKQIKEIHISGIKKTNKRFKDHYPINEKNIKYLIKPIQELKKIKYNKKIVMEIITKNPADIAESNKILKKLIENTKNKSPF